MLGLVILSEILYQTSANPSLPSWAFVHFYDFDSKYFHDQYFNLFDL